MRTTKPIGDGQRVFLTQLLCLTVFTVFAGLVLSGYFLLNNRLYWDNLRLFSVFRDNLHSLNHFGEIQWWSPDTQYGFPAYYFSMLGNNATTPLYVATSFVAWLLGALGIQIKSYVTIYIVYFGFLLPFMFSLGFLLLARQIFTNNRVINYLLLLASFSPGVVFCMSDYPHLDQSVYSLYFAAAYLYFMRTPCRTSFCLLSLSLFALAVSLDHIFLYWNVLFVPLFAVVCLCFHAEGLAATAKRLYRSVPGWYWICAAVLVVVCALPNILVYFQGENLIRSTIGRRVYDYAELKPGNPLEFLSVATPGIGFEWVGAKFALETVEGLHVSYGYMGALSLTLLILGLMFGQPRWRKRLFVMIAFCAGVFALSGYSPLFSVLLVPPTPLHAVKHHSDCVFRIGTFVLYLLAIGLGMEALLNRERHLRRPLVITFAVTSLFSVFLYAKAYFGTSFHFDPVMPQDFLGFYLVMLLLYSVAVVWIARSRHAVSRNRLFVFVALLTFIDISTAAFWHVRNIAWPSSKIVAEAPPGYLGTGDGPATTAANIVLKQREVLDLARNGIDPDRLPVGVVSRSARATYDARDFAADINAAMPYVVLSEEHRNIPQFAQFFTDAPADTPALSAMFTRRQTYNSLSLTMVSETAGLYFWRDAYSPYWKATVNGVSAPIGRAFGAFKAIAIPAGKSSIEFRFSPGPVPVTLALAYLVVLASAGACLSMFVAARKGRDEEPHETADSGVSPAPRDGPARRDLRESPVHAIRPEGGA